MTFTIPNTADAAFADMAAPDSRDFDVLANGLATSGVQLGAYTDCAVTPSAGMVLNVAAGVVRVRGTRTIVTAGTATVTTANATNPRFDLVIVTKTTGARSVIAGTAAVSPAFPVYDPDTQLVLAAVRVAAADTTIGSTEIVDKRVFVPTPVDQAARATDNTSTSTTITDAGATTMFDVAPGSYLLEVRGHYRSSLTSAGPRFGVGGTATVTTVQGTVEMWTALPATAPSVSVMTAANTGYGANPGTADADFPVRMDAYAVVTVAGTLGVRWLMSAASTGNFRTGSWARLTKVA